MLNTRAQLDEDRNITALVPRQSLEVHETVAECMIYANCWVARKIQEAFPHHALLRRHPPPRQELFSQLVNTAKARGFTIDTRTNKALADSLDRAVAPQDPLVNRLLRMMATQAMSQAVYFSTGSHPEDQFYHYGLALDRYTHFTSPIRRYADIVVHRLLTAALAIEKGAELVKAQCSNKDMEELAEHINSRNRAAQQAQSSSVGVFQCLFFKERDPQQDPRCVSDAIIYSIRDNGVLVFIPEYGVKAPVYMKNKDCQVVSVGSDGSCEWQSGTIQRFSDHISTTSNCGSAIFRLFDHITVRISVISNNFHANTLNLEVISNKPHLSAAPQQSYSHNRNQVVQEVVRLAEEAQEKAAQKPKFSKEEREFRQSRTPNLYSLMEEVRELALMDLDTISQICATTA
ncbi:DIS3-like exonuclease 1 [Nematolebias whitei]|uniref:DIS3-like exonuclease 1 n=1 Tax=Nematolebias whitei TaxID=451745 RepID=UPI001896C5A1|nr:DIS3-like exonuclease 1 [Nematolebias whitei]